MPYGSFRTSLYCLVFLCCFWSVSPSLNWRPPVWVVPAIANWAGTLIIINKRMPYCLCRRSWYCLLFCRYLSLASPSLNWRSEHPLVSTIPNWAGTLIIISKSTPHSLYRTSLYGLLFGCYLSLASPSLNSGPQHSTSLSTTMSNWAGTLIIINKWMPHSSHRTSLYCLLFCYCVSLASPSLNWPPWEHTFALSIMGNWAGTLLSINPRSTVGQSQLPNYWYQNKRKLFCE